MSTQKSSGGTQHHSTLIRTQQSGLPHMVYGADVFKDKIKDEKRGRGLSWKRITEGIGPGSPVLYTAALVGQMTLTKSEAENAAKLLGLSEAEAAILTESPNRGSLTTLPPTDPLFIVSTSSCRPMEPHGRN
jgi:hypothetical protein